jgi:hypothetical protein
VNPRISALVVAMSLLAGRASASSVLIEFSGVVTYVDEGSPLPSLPTVGERFTGRASLDLASVEPYPPAPDEEPGIYRVFTLPVELSIGGLAMSSSNLIYVADAHTSDTCAGECDSWAMTLGGSDPDPQSTNLFSPVLALEDETASLVSSSDFFVPADLADWSHGYLRIIEPAVARPGGGFGPRLDVEGQLDSFRSVPEPQSLALGALAALATAIGTRRRNR